MTVIPLIDLDRWFDGSPTDQLALAAEVDQHLQRLGFLVVVNHRVPPDVIAACRAEARRFFHLPAAAKAATALRPGGAYRGWVGPGLESNAATYGIDTPPDLKETFAYGPVDVVDPTLREREPVSYGPNRWPAEPAGFQPAAEAWWRAGRSLTDELLDICALALGLPRRHLREQSAATTAQVSLNWYGPRGTTEPEPGQFRIGPHTDFGTLTILDREPGAGGLQVLDEHGTWIDAPYVAGGLLINTGDMIRRWTNDRWCSNEHRVLPPPATDPTEELISLIFFHEPDHGAVVEAFESCVSADAPAKYAPIVAHEYLAEKMAALSVADAPVAPTIPTIDIGATRAAGLPVGDIAEQVDRACREVGFFAITGHGIADELRAAVLDAAQRFFALPAEVKHDVAIERSDNNRGYAGIAGERLQPDLPADLKETFDIGPERAADEPGLSPLDGPNQWPDLDDFRTTLEQYQAQAIDVARLLLRVVAEANGLPVDFFDACHEHPQVTTRLLHYPQVHHRTADEQLGCGAHSDYGCLTLLYCDGTPGLQLLRVDDEWIDVDVPDGAIIVNLGDLLQRWTNDRYRSTQHRVIPPISRDRYAVPVFVNPQWSTEVACLPSCVSDERPARYPPVLAGEYLQSRYNDTFIYRETAPA